MTQLKKYKLSEVAKVEISGVDKKTQEGEKPVRLCNFTDVYYNWAITKKLEPSFMHASANQNEISRFSLKKGQVAFTKDSETRDDIGVSAYIADDFDDVILGYHCALITPDESKVDGAYVNAFMHTSLMQKYFANNASGSGQRYSLSVDTMENIPLFLPSLDEQHKIASLLSNLDRKIEINRAISANLEALARQLYEYWFVQFDFPDANGKHYKSSGGKMVYNDKLKREIPEGWEVRKVKEHIEPIERGISYSSDEIASSEGVPMINLACYSKQGDYRTGELKFFSGDVKDDKKVLPFDMFVACTDMTQGADVIGRPILATEEYSFYVYSMDLAKITPRDIAKFYLYYSLRTPFYHSYIKPFASGTNVKHLNVKGIEDYCLTIPTKQIQERFDDIILPIKKKQMGIINEIASLTRQRDELLPLLMNGQVTIE